MIKYKIPFYFKNFLFIYLLTAWSYQIELLENRIISPVFFTLTETDLRLPHPHIPDVL